MINSNQGYEISISSIDGMTIRLGVIGYNEEHTPNDLNNEDITDCPAIADLETPFIEKTFVNSEFLTTDILEGEWIMAATDRNGNPLETTVKIIREYKAGRDYPEEFSGEDQFIEQAEIFNQKRLKDKNSLLMLGWFQASYEDYGRFDFRSPYDLLVSHDYVAYDHKQLFFDAGPKLFIEVDDEGGFIARTKQSYLPATRWTGYYDYYIGYYPLADAGQYIDFPITISDDKKTMAISSVDGSFLNLISTGDYAVPVVIQSEIMLTKK